jgi:hypothetical protein
MAARQYSSTATSKTLTSITTDELTVSPDISTLPTVYPYTLVIDPDTASEEIVTVRSLKGGAVLYITRGQDGTSLTSHNSGAIIKHMITPRDMQEPQNHIEAASAYTIKNDGFDAGVTGPTIAKSLHGIASGEGSVVGTLKSQTLTNKTLTSPVITGGTVNGGAALTVDSTELNKLDGVTTTTAQLNYLNTSSSNIQTQLDAKAPIASPTFTGTVAGITKSMVGLSNVDNTTDAGKPVSSATQTALDGKLSLSGGNLSGNLASTGFGQFQTDQAAGRGLAVTQPSNGSAAIIQFLNNAGNAQRGTITATTAGTIGITPASGSVAIVGTLNGTGSINSDNNIYSFYQIGNNWASFHESASVGYCRPIDDNDTNLGTSANRWIRVYAMNATISTSDERSKLDVTDSPLGLDFINDLRPVSYRWKVGQKKALTDEDGKLILDENGNKTYEVREGVRKHYGLISQEVKQAVDNSGVDDFAGWVQDDMSDPDSYQSLSYEQFIAPLIKSVQELSAEVQTLKAKVAELEAK